jgi:hypothetical protein
MIEVAFTSDPLPVDFQGTLEDFRTRFITNLRGTISRTQVLVGQIGGSEPLSNIGPWLNIDTWYVWNGSDYVPTTLKVGNSTYQVTLSNEFTGVKGIVPDKVQTLQDKSGVIALLSDVYEGRPSIIMGYDPPGVSTLDWGAGSHFFLLLTSNTTIKSINMLDGQDVIVAIRNAASSFTVTWPTFIFWTGGTPPVQSVTNKTDLYILSNIGGSVFGRQIAGYP